MKKKVKIPTGFKANDDSELFVGDWIKVPDNPDIAPWDIGMIIENETKYGWEMNYKFLFVGQLSIAPLEYYKKEEIERYDWRGK